MDGAAALMRVFVVDTFYPAFLAAHYGAHAGLAERSYDEQWRSLMATAFGTADAYSHYLRERGHEAHEFIVNCGPLQDAWAREHGVRRRRFRSNPPLVLRQAEDFAPDVVYVQNLSVLDRATLRALRARSSLLVGQIASEPPPRQQLEPFDLILTSFPHFVPMFRGQGIRSELFRIGFDPRVLDRVETTGPREGVAFVGSLARTQHDRGNALLERAARRAPIDFWGYGGDDWPADSPIKRRYRGEAWGLDMYRVLGHARIALNRHIDVAADYANNMRLYEATGVGALLLTDRKRNLAELFEPAREVAVYDDEDDLVAKIAYYLGHEDERADVARAGQARCLAEHTYAQRMAELEELLSRYLG